MSGRFLLDTNSITAFLGREPAVLAHLAQAEYFTISCITAGELRYGAPNSDRVEANLHRIDELLRDAIVIGCDEQTSDLYARCKIGLKRKGQPINENALWIAATATQHKLTLVSRNNDFAAIDDLSLARW